MWSQHWSAVNLHSFSWPAGGGENHLLLTWFTPSVNNFLMSSCSQSFVSRLSIHSINYGPITSRIADKSGFTVRRGYPVIDTHNNHQSAPPSHPNMVSRNKKIVTDIKPKSSSFKMAVCRKFDVDWIVHVSFFRFQSFLKTFSSSRSFTHNWYWLASRDWSHLVRPFFPQNSRLFHICERNYWTDSLPRQNTFLVSLFFFFFFFLQCFFRHTSKLCHHGAKHGCLEICDTTENPAGFLSKWANTQKKT